MYTATGRVKALARAQQQSTAGRGRCGADPSHFRGARRIFFFSIAYVCMCSTNVNICAMSSISLRSQAVSGFVLVDLGARLGVINWSTTHLLRM
jgi:hypothetical protein